MNRHPMTLTQKILASHAIGLTRPWVQAGDIVQVKVDWTIASELAWNGMDRTYSMLGRPKIHDVNKFFLAVDHTVDPVTLSKDPRTLRLVELSRAFAKESGIRHFYDANQTILHTKFYRDLVQPGEIVLGADSHTSSHGGLGAFSIGLGGADITAAMVLGQSWIEVPEAIAIDYSGELPFGIGGKDVILKTLGTLGRNTVAMEKSVEYRGDIVKTFTTDMRFTIANMTAEFGGLNGIFEADGVVAAWLAQREGYNAEASYFRADHDAPYQDRFPIALSKLGPQIAKPFSPDNIVAVEATLGMKLDGAFIGACTTTEEELVLGALVLEKVLKDRKAPVVPTTKRLVVPGSIEIEKRLKENGSWAIYQQAGYRVGVPGCSMCLGVASEKAEKGEHWITSQNRNFRNRMGEGSFAYLASGATVAASSSDMAIADPRPYLAQIDQDRYAKMLHRQPSKALPEIRLSEPEVKVSAASAATDHGAEKAGMALTGRIQRFGEQIDTDAIIPGEFCHLTSFKELGDHAFHHVKANFPEQARGGANIIVAGDGWGSGSSREQAVWALQGAGIQAVIARSYAFIHKRNLVNEALPHLVVKDPVFFELAKDDETVIVDLSRGEVTIAGKVFKAEGGSPIVQALTREGGLVPAIKRHGQDVFAKLAT